MKSSWRFVEGDELAELEKLSVSYPSDKQVSQDLLESIAGIHKVAAEGKVRQSDGKVVTIPPGSKICTRTDGESLVCEAIDLSVHMGGSVVNLKTGVQVALLPGTV